MALALRIEIQESRPRPFASKFVVRIAQPALVERQTPAADALAQLIAQRGQPLDALVEFVFPAPRQRRPVARVDRAIGRQRIQHLANLGERDAGALTDLDHGDPPQLRARKTPLIAVAAFAADKPLRLPEMKRRHRQPAAFGDLADG